MLAAGTSERLGNMGGMRAPKILLRFDGKILLQYHIEILKRHGIDELVIGVGYQSRDIEQEISVLGAQDFVRTVFNKDYREGSIVTLSLLCDELCRGAPILLMDAGVLYCQQHDSASYSHIKKYIKPAFGGPNQPINVVARLTRSTRSRYILRRVE